MPKRNPPCRHGQESRRKHTVMTDIDGNRHLLCPGSLEDNTFDPEPTADEIKSLLHASVY